MRVAAFTLLEVLLVAAIIALAAALLFPIVSSAKRSAHQSTCVQQLRQIGLALAMYEDAHGARPPSFEAATDAGLLKDVRLTKCPVDPVDGYASRWDRCSGKTHPYPQSYETIFGWYDFQIRRLEAADANHGVVACRLHGARTSRFSEGMSDFCEKAWFMYEGTLLRLRKDGSLQTAKLSIKRKQRGLGLSEETVGVWELFTDAPMPPKGSTP
jgi:type II secretory pathway pseudopilin PulG